MLEEEAFPLVDEGTSQSQYWKSDSGSREKCAQKSLAAPDPSGESCPTQPANSSLLQEGQGTANSLPLPFFSFLFSLLLKRQNILETALYTGLLFMKPPISLLQDVAWIQPITSSLDV